MSELVGPARVELAAVPRPLWRQRAFLLPLAAAGLAALALPLWWKPLSALLYDLEFGVAKILPEETIAGAAWFVLPGFGFGAGLLASFSPCILPLVPLNLAAIGAIDMCGRRAAWLSARFVLGAALALAVLGLAGDLAGTLLVEQRGTVLLAAGLAILYMGLAAVDVLPVPFAGRSFRAGRALGPISAGAAFSLVTSPCASPLLGSVLAASGSQGVPGLSVLSMVAFAVGYTALIFAVGVFGGALMAPFRRMAMEGPRVAEGALMVVLGGGFAAAGISWF